MTGYHRSAVHVNGLLRLIMTTAINPSFTGARYQKLNLQSPNLSRYISTLLCFFSLHSLKTISLSAKYTTENWVVYCAADIGLDLNNALLLELNDMKEKIGKDGNNTRHILKSQEKGKMDTAQRELSYVGIGIIAACIVLAFISSLLNYIV